MINRFYTILASGFVVCTIALACGGGQNSGNSQAAAGNGDAVEGKKVYERYCVLCHGADGKKEMNGAKDITISQLTFDERVALVRGGRNLMTPFEGILSEQEMADVSAYSMTLGK